MPSKLEPTPTTLPALPTTPLAEFPEVRDGLSRTVGWAELLAALRAGDSGTIDGAWGSSAALAAGMLARHNGFCVLIVLPYPGDLDAWSGDLASFTGQTPTLFPGWQTWPIHVEERDDTAGQRLRVLRELANQPPSMVLTSMAAVLQPVPTPEELAQRGRKLKAGQSLDSEELARWLVEHGYKRVDAVEFPGDFSLRGGIIDVYSPDAAEPFRLELFGDEIESIRPFAVETQRSLESRPEIVLLGSAGAQASAALGRGHVCDHLPSGAWVILVEPVELTGQGHRFHERISDPAGLFSTQGCLAQLITRPSITITALPSPSVEATCHLGVESVERFTGNIERVREELDSIAHTDRVLVACSSEAEIHRLGEILAESQLAASERLRLGLGQVQAGFRLLGIGDEGLVILGSHQLFQRALLPGTGGAAPTQGKAGARKVETRAIDSFLDLNPGDYVVHVAHGIGLFRGLQMLPRKTPGGRGDAASPAARSAKDLEEHLILEFRDGAKVYVPAAKIDLVQKYVGSSAGAPPLSKLGGVSWQRKKDKVEEAVRDLAAEMLQLQAVRAAQPGYGYPTDSAWQSEFEASFAYQETPDQLAAVAAIKTDLERPRPMDRLLCGDVGYGKTEVALRAAFKVIDHGRQVAVLVPTTILAEQHYRTFRDRLSEYPFTVAALSRFRSSREQKKTLEALAQGGIDIIIGTHRLLSSDVRFQELGLVIIDEEQRFGVEHKERLKQLRTTVDVLTMSATPIPRTLHQALLGIRDISNLETPPPERLPVETRVIRFDEELVRHAILRELNRQGQVYFVHNRVQDIDQVAHRLATMVPEARLVVGHGQMAEQQLERAMVSFIRREADVLVATTIIESGVDIPNANTMFIDEADRYGLADLHQLRGRVGRTKTRAYCYLLIDPKRTIGGQAALRLKAIEEFRDLGAGFRIAMRDLEIRGAGNLLGTEQAGHIGAVGYELYCELLDNAVRRLTKQPVRTPLQVSVDLGWPASLPREYIPVPKQRLEAYRRLARIRERGRLEDFRAELRDRYGPLPETAQWLLRQTEVRLLCARWQVTMVHRDGADLVLSYRGPRKIRQLAELAHGRVKVVDEKSAYIRLEPGEETDEALYQLLVEVLSKERTPAHS